MVLGEGKENHEFRRVLRGGCELVIGVERPTPPGEPLWISLMRDRDHHLGNDSNVLPADPGNERPHAEGLEQPWQMTANGGNQDLEWEKQPRYPL